MTAVYAISVNMIVSMDNQDKENDDIHNADDLYVTINNAATTDWNQLITIKNNKKYVQ